MDHPSEDPPMEPLVDSLLQPGGGKEDSSEMEKLGDLWPCRRRWCPGERRAHRVGVELVGRWLRDDKGDADRDESDWPEGDILTGDVSEAATDSADSFTSVERFLEID